MSVTFEHFIIVHDYVAVNRRHIVSIEANISLTALTFFLVDGRKIIADNMKQRDIAALMRKLGAEKE